jgi:hypothetical protein
MATPPKPDLAQMLPMILGQVGGLSGNRGFAKRWAELEQQKQQQQQQATEEERRQAQLQMQQDANQRAQEQQRIAGVNSIRQLLDVNQVADMDEYTQREAFASKLAPTLGVDPGFIQSLRPNPTRFEVNEAKKLLGEIDKTYAPAQLAMLETDDQTGSAPVFTLKSGKQMTLGQLRQLAGTQPIDPKTGAGVSMRVPAKPDVPNTAEEQHIADTLAAAEEKAGRPLSRGEKAQIRLRAKREWVAASDRTPDGGSAPDQMWVIRDGKPTPIPKGSARPGDMPYDAVAARQQAGGEAGPSAYSRERAARTVQSVDELMGKVSRWTTGFGSWLAVVPESEAVNFASELETLKANIAFNELTQMREASKTGGALGQVSNVELGLLTAALGALNTKQSPANLKKQLEKIKASILRFNAAQEKAGQSANQPLAPMPSHGGWTDVGNGFKVREVTR